MADADGPEAAPAPVAKVDRLAVGFARLLRVAGLDVPVGATLVFAEALGAVGVRRRDAVYWAGRTTLVRQPEDGNGCEYSLVVTVRNDRGEELTRQVIAVGGMKPSEARIFTVWVETYSPEDRQEPATLGKTAEPNGRD